MHLAGSVNHSQQTPETMSDSAGRNANYADNHGWLSEETMSALSLNFSLASSPVVRSSMYTASQLLSFEAHPLMREKKIKLCTCHTASDL
jgi:hypothetical protein